MYFNGSSAVSFVNLSFMLMKHSRAEEWEGAEISSARGCYTVGQKSKTAWTVIDGAALPGNLILSCIGAKYTGEDSIKLTWQEECGGHGACHHHPQNIECDLAPVHKICEQQGEACNFTLCEVAGFPLLFIFYRSHPFM